MTAKTAHAHSKQRERLDILRVLSVLQTKDTGACHGDHVQRAHSVVTIANGTVYRNFYL